MQSSTNNNSNNSNSPTRLVGGTNNHRKKHHNKQSKKHSIDVELLTRQMLRRMQKFYLVGITGRTSFILENLREKKFKITIGNQIECSCLTQNNYHCLHTLYVLTQIFYLPSDHQLLLQSKYTDKELRYIIANRRIHLNRISDFLNFIKKKQVVKSKKGTSTNSNSPNRHQRHQPNGVIIQEQQQDNQQEDSQSICAICHMHIVKSDPVTACTNVCRNIFHFDCFSQWMKHQLKNDGVVKCPLCRDQKTQEALLQIKMKEYEMKESINFSKVGVCYNYYCDGCQLKEIEENAGAVYKCVTCENVTLCSQCYNSGKHIKHTFVCKPAKEKKWKDCEVRKGKKKLDAEQGCLKMKLPTYKRLYNFLACTYPTYFSKNNRWNVVQCKKLDIKIEQLQCMMCSDPQKSFLRRLPCGHFIHHKCLRKRIQKGILYCKYQGRKFLLGYESLLKQQELNKKVQFEINAATDNQQEIQQRQKQKQNMADGDEDDDENICNYVQTANQTTSKPSRSRSRRHNRLQPTSPSNISMTGSAHSPQKKYHRNASLSNSKTLKSFIDNSGGSSNVETLQSSSGNRDRGHRNRSNNKHRNDNTSCDSRRRKQSAQSAAIKKQSSLLTMMKYEQEEYEQKNMKELNMRQREQGQILQDQLELGDQQQITSWIPGVASVEMVRKNTVK